MGGVLLLLLLVGCAPHRPWEQARMGQELVVRPEEGVANLRIGQSMAAVRRRVGEPEVQDRFEDAEYWTWPSIGLSIAFEGGHTKSLFFYSGIQGGYETRVYHPFPGRIPVGTGSIGLDARRADVEILLGAPLSTGDLSEAPVPAVWGVWPGGLEFCFVAETGQLIYVSLSRP